MQKIILDTDIGGDCDDVGALALLNVFCRRGLAKLLAVTVDTYLQTAPAAAAAINAYYGNNDVPVGIIKEGGNLIHDDIYATELSKRFPTRYSDAPAPDGVKLIREILSKNKVKDIKIVGIGKQCLLARLLSSGPDEISEKTGMELLEENVSETVLMGGNFEISEPESNIASDISSAVAIAQNWPMPVTYAPYELGIKIKTGKKLMLKNPKHPMSIAYKIHSNGDRYSWDPVAVLYAVAGAGKLYKLTPFGEVVFSETGVSSFLTEGEKKHRYLTNAAPFKEIEEVIDDMLTEY